MHGEDVGKAQEKIQRTTEQLQLIDSVAEHTENTEVRASASQLKEALVISLGKYLTRMANAGEEVNR